MNTRPAPVLSDDLLYGEPAISSFLGLRRSKAFALLRRGKLPAFKLGGIWTARRSTLLAHIERLEVGEPQ